MNNYVLDLLNKDLRKLENSYESCVTNGAVDSKGYVACITRENIASIKLAIVVLELDIDMVVRELDIDQVVREAYIAGALEGGNIEDMSEEYANRVLEGVEK
jgi:intein-encoded DNA endonuclease-like protein